MIIGIIGGGQLGLMMAQAAKELGHVIYSLDPDETCPIHRISDRHIVASFNNQNAILELIKSSDIVTYEFENINLDYILENDYKIPQGIRPLKISQNRLLEKNTISELGIATPNYSVFREAAKIQFPSVIKSISGGYDGKNQYVINDKNDIDKLEINALKEYIVEEYIEFDYEISVVLTRDVYNTVVTYPIPVNTHVNGILHTSVINDSIPKEIKSEVENISKAIVENLNYVGTMAIEYFVKDNKILFNEFAPRPHNSGHYTIEACNVSQFKNHILAITGEHIVEPVLKKDAIMVNILGQNSKYIQNSNLFNDVYVHIYGKKENRFNRKIGHINIMSDNNFAILQDIVKEQT